jgi:hypothetical protein
MRLGPMHRRWPRRRLCRGKGHPRHQRKPAGTAPHPEDIHDMNRIEILTKHILIVSHVCTYIVLLEQVMSFEFGPIESLLALYRLLAQGRKGVFQGTPLSLPITPHHSQ